MEQMTFQNTQLGKSREEKIREAKSCFKSSGSFSSGSGWKESTEYPENDYMDPEPAGRSYGLCRFAAAILLFFILVTAFHFKVSYRGWNRGRIEKVLSDDSHYQYIVKQAEMAIKKIEPKGK